MRDENDRMLKCDNKIIPPQSAESEGKLSISVDCKFNNAGKDALLKLETRTFGTKQKIVLK